jgi:hypothetical protein
MVSLSLDNGLQLPFVDDETPIQQGSSGTVVFSNCAEICCEIRADVGDTGAITARVGDYNVLA